MSLSMLHHQINQPIRSPLLEYKPALSGGVGFVRPIAGWLVSLEVLDSRTNRFPHDVFFHHKNK